MESSIYDSDFNEQKLDKLIGEKPELVVLKSFGEILVDLDGEIDSEDNRFDAPYQNGWVKGGSVDQSVKSFKVTWYPNEDDIDSLEELVNHDELSKDVFEKFKKLVLSEPKISYDLTDVITDKKKEELESEYIAEFGDD